MKHATATDIGSPPASEAAARGFGVPGMRVGPVRGGAGRQQPVVPGPLRVTNTPPAAHKHTSVGPAEPAVAFLFTYIFLFYFLDRWQFSLIRTYISMAFLDFIFRFIVQCPRFADSLFLRDSCRYSGRLSNLAHFQKTNKQTNPTKIVVDSLLLHFFFFTVSEFDLACLLK